MSNYTARKASPIIPGDDICDATITIAGQITDEDSPTAFAEDASEIAEALWSHLPGGTIDALIGALLAKRASQFRVRFPQQENANV